ARGGTARVSVGAGHRPVARHRARVPAPAAGRAAAFLASRARLGAAVAPLGDRVRAADRAAGGRGRGRLPARPGAVAAARAAERRRAGTLPATAAHRRGPPGVLAALA